MTLQQIVNSYVKKMNSAKSSSKAKAIMSGSYNNMKDRSDFYYDTHYILELQKKTKNPYTLIYACVFNPHRHLWHMNSSLAQTVTTVLDSNKVINGKYKDFEYLYKKIRSLIIPIKNIGDVSCYDIALRIGFLLKIYPQNMVYYHVKLRASARKLLGVSRVYSYNCDINKFRKLLPDIPSIFLEDMLCVMHDDFVSSTFTVGKTPVSFPWTINDYFFK